MFKVTSKSLSYVFCILLVAFNPFATEKSGIVKLKQVDFYGVTKVLGRKNNFKPL